MNLGAAEKSLPPRFASLRNPSAAPYFLAVAGNAFPNLAAKTLFGSFYCGNGPEGFSERGEKTPGSCHIIASAIVYIIRRQVGL